MGNLQSTEIHEESANIYPPLKATILCCVWVGAPMKRGEHTAGHRASEGLGGWGRVPEQTTFNVTNWGELWYCPMVLELIPTPEGFITWQDFSPEPPGHAQTTSSLTFTSNRLLPSCFHTLPQLLFVLCPAHSLRKHTCRLMMPNLAFPLLLVFTKHMSLQLVVFFFFFNGVGF